MKFHTFILALVVALPSIVNGQQQVLALDCPVSKANPIFDLADLKEGAIAVLMERYRFVISIGDRAGLATTLRASGIPAQILESNTDFQVDFENKRVVIDRMTAEFHVFILGAQQPLGGGTCTKVDQRKF